MLAQSGAEIILQHTFCEQWDLSSLQHVDILRFLQIRQEKISKQNDKTGYIFPYTIQNEKLFYSPEYKSDNNVLLSFMH